MCRTKTEFRSAIAKYRKLKAEEARIKAQLSEVQEDIFNYFDTHGVAPKERVSGQNYYAFYSLCESTSLDSKKLCDILGDLTPYQKHTQYRRLYVK